MRKWCVALSLLSASVSASEPIKVAVIDTGLDLNDPRVSAHLCSSGHRDFTNTGIKDTNGHGTHIVGLIEQYAKDANYCLIILKYFDVKLDTTLLEIDAIKWAIDQNASYINISGGGDRPNYREEALIRLHPEVTFVLAAGNEDHDLAKKPFYPASYPYRNIFVVGALDEDGQKASYSNYGARVDAWEIGTNVLSLAPSNSTAKESGTSQATAIHTGKMIYEVSH